MRQQKITFYKETVRYNLWAKYFTDVNHKDTWGNATQSAIKAYGYDSPDRYHLASVTGSKNMRKYEYLAVGIADMMGFGFGQLMKIGIKKALDGSYKDWDSLMVRLGYFEVKEPPHQYNQFNQFNFKDIGEAIAQSRKERGLAV